MELTKVATDKGKGAVRHSPLAVRFHSKLVALRLLAVLLGYRPSRFAEPQYDTGANFTVMTAVERCEAILNLMRETAQAEADDVLPTGQRAQLGDDGILTDDEVEPLF